MIQPSACYLSLGHTRLQSSSFVSHLEVEYNVVYAIYLCVQTFVKIRDHLCDSWLINGKTRLQSSSFLSHLAEEYIVVVNTGHWYF